LQTEAVQEQFLRDLLTHQDTELGQKYGLSEIKTIDQFRDRFPSCPTAAMNHLLIALPKVKTTFSQPIQLST